MYLVPVLLIVHGCLLGLLAPMLSKWREVSSGCEVQTARCPVIFPLGTFLFSIYITESF
jgi:hypothetical protein